MRFPRLSIIISLMGLALIGVIGVQFYWIHQAEELNRQQFRHGVHAAMQMVVNKLQVQEAGKFFDRNQLYADSTRKYTPIQGAVSGNLSSLVQPTNSNNYSAAPKLNSIAIDSTGIPPTSYQPQSQRRYSNDARFAANQSQISNYPYGQLQVGWFGQMGDPEMQTIYTWAEETHSYRQIQPEQGKKAKNNGLQIEFNDSSFYSKYTGPKSHGVSQHFSMSGTILDANVMSALRQEILNRDMDSMFSLTFGMNMFADNPFADPYYESYGSPTLDGNEESHFKLAAFNPPGLDYSPSLAYDKGHSAAKNPTATHECLDPQNTIENPSGCADAYSPNAPQSQESGCLSKEKMLSKVNYLEQFVRHLVRSEKDMRSRVDSAALNQMIADELRHYGIDQPFAYAVYSPNRDQTVYAHQISYEDAKSSAFQVRLFPNDLLSAPHYLTLVFPAQNRFAGNYGILALASLFILLIVFCFGYTVNTIFQQKKLGDMKTDFINNMTHEFKTPITTISLASEALKSADTPLNETQRLRFANMIFDENKRLESQVERVLQMAKLDRGEVKLKYSTVNLHEIIENALQKVQLQVEKRNGVIEKHLNAPNALLVADAVHLTNMVYNLLDNAIKYSPEELHISIETENTANGLALSIVDRGIGMSAEQQRHIFEKFYRAPSATKNRHDVKGFGLGLSYVKMMAEAHGGEIRVRSELKKGSRFSLLVPFNQEMKG